MTNAGKHAQILKPHTLLVGMQNRCRFCRNCMEVPQKTENMSYQPHFCIFFQKIEIRISRRY